MTTNSTTLPVLKSTLRHIPRCGYVPMSIVQDTPFVDGYTLKELELRNISVYSNMVHNRFNSDPEGEATDQERLAREHWILNNTVSLWNVAVEAPVLISGPHAEYFANMLTTQDLTRCSPGQGKYTPILNNEGGIINDPVLYRLAEDQLLFTSSDNNMFGTAQDFLDGLRAAGRQIDVEVSRPDMAMVQVQGPRAIDVMREVLGNENFMTDDEFIPYYWLTECEKVNGQWTPAPNSKIRREMTCHDGTVVEIATPRTGFSRLPGFECIVYNVSRVGKVFWETMVEAVRRHEGDHIGPGHTQRIPGGILSFGNDITRDGKTNPFEVYVDEVQLNRIVPESKEAWYRGKEAVERLRAEGPTRKLAGIRIMGSSVGWYNDGSMSRLWQVYDREEVHWLPDGTYIDDNGLVFYQDGSPVFDSEGSQLTDQQAVHVEYGRPELLDRVYVLPDSVEELGDVTSACWSPQHEINIARGFAR